MAKNYFENIPNFEYVSRLPGAKTFSDYVETKNLFKRAKIRPDIFNDLTHFTKYQIVGDERPDEVSNKLYDTPDYDWIILLSNNIINVENEWPLTQQSFENYLLNKYNTTENIYNVHHYETTEIRDKNGSVIIPKGLQVPENYTVTFFDQGLGEEVIASNFTLPITNYTYEERIQDQKRNIYCLKGRYIGLILNDMDEIMPYKKGSSQYVDTKTVKGDNIRLYQ